MDIDVEVVRILIDENDFLYLYYTSFGESFFSYEKNVKEAYRKFQLNEIQKCEKCGEQTFCDKKNEIFKIKIFFKREKSFFSKKFLYYSTFYHSFLSDEEDLNKAIYNDYKGRKSAHPLF